MGEGPPIWGGMADYLSGVPLGVLITLFGGGDIMLYLCYGALQCRVPLGPKHQYKYTAIFFTTQVVGELF